MKIAIVGYGSQGKSSFEYWNTSEHEVTVCDQLENTMLPDGAKQQLGKDYLKNLDKFDLIVRSPLVHPRQLVEANSPEILNKVTSNTNEFMQVCPSRNSIGVTGTKGKGTTSTLIQTILEAAGHTAHLGGNIGTPPLQMLKGSIKPEDWVVLELANFQLIDLKYSPTIGVCLMVEPEHLDWHEDLDEYIAAKQQMFINQEEKDSAIYYAKNDISLSVADATSGTLIPYMETPGAVVENGMVKIGEIEICPVAELKLPGQHNWQNVCAAVTATWQITQDVDAMRRALTTFKGLPFRIEHRRTVNGVAYYDDSFATGPGATIAAIEAIKENKVLILGGHDRGLSLEPLADVIKEHEQDIAKVILVGASAGRIKEVLEHKGYSNYVEESSRDMNSIVRRASEFANNGDAVLLSPAFASFDMFKNFEERGVRFNEAVDSL